MPNISITQLRNKKLAGEKFAVLTAYDATFARLAAEAGIEVILVGDSLGMVLQGHDSTLPVTVADMAYHVAAVVRGNTSALVIADLPFGSYALPAQTLDSAATLMRAGAHAVKLEGGRWLTESIRLLTERGIPVCAHLGLTPQSVNIFGGYKVQGRQPDQAAQMLADAQALEAAGAILLVLECVPQILAQQITQALDIPVIGIGAGPHTDAQVLVLHDMLGLSVRAPKFVRNFMVEAKTVQEALTNYRSAVINGQFPTGEHSFD
ncbi:MAG TPA: 3-methyl-2-oxobutanoate hydroxymethyltransferase [Spongiibacteraceae bacterium]|nr:3-methyl-2-oxobutanoate hydroxymethyltransferase [Spongiibacteraceae bacterium]